MIGDGEDYDLPNWKFREYPAPHDWRKYASEELRAAWTSFTLEQRRIVGRCLQEIADREEWD